MKIQKKDTVVDITEGAALEIKKLIKNQNISSDLCLRLGVKSGGCSGFSYVIGFDDVKDDDDQFCIHDINVVIKKAHLLHLAGITLDYQNGLNNRGFIFDNPNASDTCGCGTSFSTE